MTAAELNTLLAETIDTWTDNITNRIAWRDWLLTGEMTAEETARSVMTYPAEHYTQYPPPCAWEYIRARYQQIVRE